MGHRTTKGDQRLCQRSALLAAAAIILLALLLLDQNHLNINTQAVSVILGGTRMSCGPAHIGMQHYHK